MANDKTGLLPLDYGTFQDDPVESEVLSRRGSVQRVLEVEDRKALSKTPCGKGLHLSIHRDAFTQINLDKCLPPVPPEKKPFTEKIRSFAKRNCSCSPDFALKLLYSWFPVFSWLPKYQVKNDLLSDFVSGITVLVMHIPQGMAYALLVGVPPIYGLYSSFYPVFIYFMMGTSRHISMGTSAIPSLLTAIAVKETQDVLKTMRVNAMADIQFQSNDTSNIPHSPDSVPEFSNVEIAMVVAFTAGLIQIIMGLFRIGGLIVFMSDEMISGFVTASSVHVLTSQIKAFTGAKFPAHTGPFNMILEWVSFFEYITTSNYVALLLGFTSIVILVIFKEFVSKFFMKKWKIPFPAELLLVVSGTVVSYFMHLRDDYHVSVVGKLSTGLLVPSIPRFTILPYVITSSTVLSLVSIAICVSLAIIYAKKHSYEIDYNQELIAYGCSSVTSSFFYCFPSCVSISRSAVQEGSGGKTQLASMFSCGFLLIVLLFLGPLFETLPNCVLAAVIIVSLKSMLWQVADFFVAWKKSKLDAMVWMVTFLSVIILDVDFGAITGILFSLVTILARQQNPETAILGQIPGSEVYRNIAKYALAKEKSGVKIWHYGSALYFANKETFKNDLYRQVGINPKKILSDREAAAKNSSKKSSEDNNNEKSCIFIPPIHHVIISCSAIAYTDSSGAVTLKQVIKEFEEIGITVYLAAVQEPVLESLEANYVFDEIPRCNLFATVHDAVVQATIDVATPTQLML